MHSRPGSRWIRVAGLTLLAVLLACEERAITSPRRVAERYVATVGEGHSCRLDANGVSCWGTNLLGGLGIGYADTLPHPIAEPVSMPVRFAQVDAGQYHSCALTASGEAYCWGYGALGQLGDGRRSNSGVPVRVAGGLRFRHISAGGEHSCGITTGDVAYCWGNNSSAQLASDLSKQICGPAHLPCSGVPLPVHPALPFSTLSSGGVFTCGVVRNGDTYCWGSNVIGTLGTGTLSDSEPPVRVKTDLKFVSLSAGAFHACGLTADGAAWCWGYNLTGQFGSGESSSSVPVRAAPRLTFRQISAGYLHTCGITFEGAAWCWGENKRGQLGGGTRVLLSREPVQVEGDFRFASISGGIEHSCGLTTSGETYCWGGNSWGQLGDGQPGNSYVPVRVVTFAR